MGNGILGYTRIGTFDPLFDPLNLFNRDRITLPLTYFFMSLVTLLPNFITVAIWEVEHFDVPRLVHLTPFRPLAIT